MASRLLALCSTRGLDGALLCEQAGLSARDLLDPEARLPASAVDLLIERVAEGVRAAGGLSPGLEMAMVRDPEAYDAAGLVLAASASYREGLGRALRYQRLWGDGERFRLESYPWGITVVFSPLGPPRPAHGPLSECALAEVLLGLRFLVSPEARAKRLTLAHGEHAGAEVLEGFFGVRPSFGQGRSSIELSASWVDAPVPNGNAMFLAVFERQAERACARLPGGGAPDERLEPLARAALAAALAAGDARLAVVARRLGMAGRTLQRRLREEGTSHAALLERVRRELAPSYLTRGLTIAETASLLGYAEATAFHRAFKRWTGVSPEAFRRGERACSPRPSG